MKIRKNDTVLITKGKDKGKTGKVLRVFRKQNRALVEGCNMQKKHVRPKKEGEKGQVVEVAGSLAVASLKLICSKCKKPARVGYKMVGKVKARVCKKCRGEF